MIVALSGKIVQKSPTFIHIQTNSGVTYKVLVSLQSMSLISKDDICINTTQIIREDANLLFGFMNTDEQRMFETLIKVSGIGPSTAMAVCSTLKPAEFAQVIATANVEAFKIVPGIGPKTAKRILVELSEFSLDSTQNIQNYQKDAILALESLGFKKDRVQKAILTCKSTDLQSLIKEALKKLA